MRNTLAVVVIFLSMLTLAAQNTLKGVVRNGFTNEPIPYITMGVAGKASGAITDTLGSFEIRLSESVTPQDSIVFTGLGYEHFSRCVSDFAQNEEVLLTPKSYQIADVVIKPRKSKLKTLGLQGKGASNIQFCFYTQHSIKQKSCEAPEGGIVVNLKNDCKVETFRFYVGDNQWNLAKLRLNFYSVENDLPKDLIVNRDIIFEIRDKQCGWVTVDLKPYEIYLEGDQQLAVTITLLENDTDGLPKVFMLNGVIAPFSKTIRRDRAMDHWAKIGYGRPAMSLDIISYEDKK